MMNLNKYPADVVESLFLYLEEHNYGCHCCGAFLERDATFTDSEGIFLCKDCVTYAGESVGDVYEQIPISYVFAHRSGILTGSIPGPKHLWWLT